MLSSSRITPNLLTGFSLCGGVEHYTRKNPFKFGADQDQRAPPFYLTLRDMVFNIVP